MTGSVMNKEDFLFNHGSYPAVVGDDDQVSITIISNLEQQVNHLLAIVVIEGGGWFISKDNRRGIDQCAGNGESLLFADTHQCVF